MLLENKLSLRETLQVGHFSSLRNVKKSEFDKFFLIQCLLVLNPSHPSQSIHGAFAEAMDNLENGIIRRQAACWFISFAFNSYAVVFVISIAASHKDQNEEQGEEPEMTEES